MAAKKKSAAKAKTKTVKKKSVAKKKVAAKKAVAAKPKAAPKKAAAPRKKPAPKAKAPARRKPAPAPFSPALAELDQRIAIAQNNLRDLTEQASGTSGSATEELLADRISTLETDLKRLRQERDALAKG